MYVSQSMTLPFSHAQHHLLASSGAKLACSSTALSAREMKERAKLPRHVQDSGGTGLLRLGVFVRCTALQTQEPG